MNTVKKLSWKAVRRGAIYCAPACGGDCTWERFKAARAGAYELVQKLGKGWKIRVHENLGWHYNAVSPCGRIKVSPSFHKGRISSYTAYLGDADDEICGGTWVESGRTPKSAVKNVVAKGKASLARMGAKLVGL